MRRALLLGLLLAAILGISATAAIGVQRIYADREFQRLLEAGERALEAGDSYGAVEAFSGALAFKPGAMVAFLRRGEAYREQRRFDEAVRDWREASRLAPDAPQPLVALGDLFDARGMPAEASDWYGQAADRLKDEDPSVLHRLALARFKAGSPAAALAPLKSAVARNDARPETRYLLGLVYRDIGDLPSAVTVLEDAIAQTPDFVAAREELADVYREAGRPVDEMAQLQALATRDPTPGRRVAIALAQARGGQLEGALGTLSAAESSSPNDSRVLLAIARIHLMRADRGTRRSESAAQAIAFLERALGGSASRSEGLALYGRALHLAGHYADAERILRDAVATSPVDPEAFLFLADAAEQLNHPQIARDALLNLEALQGDTAAAPARAVRARRIGELSLGAGDAVTAVRYLSRAVDAGQTSPDTLGRLARARWLTGDAAGAREALQRALAAGPPTPELQQLVRQIR